MKIDKKPLELTEVVFRDGSQSLLATRLKLGSPQPSHGFMHPSQADSKDATREFLADATASAWVYFLDESAGEYRQYSRSPPRINRRSPEAAAAY